MKKALALLPTLPLYLFAVGAPLSQAVGSLTAGLFLALALYRLIRPGRAGLLPVPGLVLISLLLYLGVHALACALADPYPSLWGKWLGEMWLKSLLVTVPLVAWRRPQDVERSLKTLVMVGALVAVYAVYQHFTGRDLWRGEMTPPAPQGYQAVGFFGHHLSYGGHVLLLLLATAWALRGMGRSPSRREAAVPWSGVVLLGLALLWSFARSAQLGAAAALVVLALSLPGRRRWAALAGLTAVAAAAVATPAVQQRFATAFQPGAEETRRNLWLSSLHAIGDRPWLGYGPGNFQRMMETHRVDGFYDTIAHSHNDFLMHGVNAGLLGLLAALLLLASTTVVLWRARRGLGRRAWIPVAAVACQVGISVGGLFQVYQTDNEVEMVLYFVLGAAFAVGAPLPMEGSRRYPQT